MGDYLTMVAKIKQMQQVSIFAGAEPRASRNSRGVRLCRA